jgi:hypothetical protein
LLTRKSAKAESAFGALDGPRKTLARRGQKDHTFHLDPEPQRWTRCDRGRFATRGSSRENMYA